MTGTIAAIYFWFPHTCILKWRSIYFESMQDNRPHRRSEHCLNTVQWSQRDRFHVRVTPTSLAVEFGRSAHFPVTER